jgi:hypothetical protein
MSRVAFSNGGWDAGCPLMYTIGLRAEPRAFNWAVAEGSLEVPVLVASDRIEVPANYLISAGLFFIRGRLQYVLDQHRATHAGIRTPEGMVKGNESLRERLRVEGVLLATCSEAGVETTQGPLATLSRLLGVKSAKVLLSSTEYRGVDLAKFSKEKREAILMSISLLRRE